MSADTFFQVIGQITVNGLLLLGLVFTLNALWARWERHQTRKLLHRNAQFRPSASRWRWTRRQVRDGYVLETDAMSPAEAISLLVAAGEKP